MLQQMHEESEAKAQKQQRTILFVVLLLSLGVNAFQLYDKQALLHKIDELTTSLRKEGAEVIEFKDKLKGQQEPKEQREPNSQQSRKILVDSLLAKYARPTNGHVLVSQQRTPSKVYKRVAYKMYKRGHMLREKQCYMDGMKERLIEKKHEARYMSEFLKVNRARAGHIHVVYFAQLDDRENWRHILDQNMKLFEESKLCVSDICTFSAVITATQKEDIEMAQDVVKKYIPKAFLTFNCYNIIEYWGLRKASALAHMDPQSVILYWHDKGVQDGRVEDLGAHVLFSIVIGQWQRVLAAFERDPSITTIGFAKDPRGVMYYQYWWARASYLNTLPTPRKSSSSKYDQHWIAGRSNPGARSFAGRGSLEFSNERINSAIQVAKACPDLMTSANLCATCTAFSKDKAAQCFRSGKDGSGFV